MGQSAGNFPHRAFPPSSHYGKLFSPTARTLCGKSMLFRNSSHAPPLPQSKTGKPVAVTEAEQESTVSVQINAVCGGGNVHDESVKKNQPQNNPSNFFLRRRMNIERRVIKFETGLSVELPV